MHVKEDKYFKILIVDENLQFRSTLATSLRLNGFYVEFAKGGFHLLHVLENEKDYSLIILHEGMNDMPAEEIISLVRTSHKKAALPILFISKIDDEATICEMIFQGANEFIVKADNYQPIIERVKKYFNLWKNN